MSHENIMLFLTMLHVSGSISYYTFYNDEYIQFNGLVTLMLLYRLTTRTQFADCPFYCSAPSVWNYLDNYIVDSCSLTVFNIDWKLWYSVRCLIRCHQAFHSTRSSMILPVCQHQQSSTKLWHFTNVTVIIIIMMVSHLRIHVSRYNDFIGLLYTVTCNMNDFLDKLWTTGSIE